MPKIKKLFFFMFVYAAVFVLTLMPHFLLTAKVFGSPFYSENWKNLAFKLYGNWDWSYFRRVPYDGPLALLRDSPTEIFFSFFRELLRFFTSTLYHFGVQGLSGTLFAASFLGGLARLTVGADRKSADVVVFLLSYVLCGCLFYYSGVRFMFPALLLACIAGINFIQRSGTRARVGAPGRAVVMVVYFTTMVYSVIVHVPKYINAHPVAELAAARGLELEFGRDIKVAGTFRFMQRYVGYDYELLDDAYNAERDDENLFFDRMKSSLERNQITYVVVGPLDLGNRPRSLLECGKAPSFLSCIHEKDGVVVYRANR